MSTWYEAEYDDIDIDAQDKCVDILVTDDDWGNIYLSLTFEQIKDLCSQIADQDE